MKHSFVVETTSAGTPQEVFAIVADGAGWSRWAGPLVPRSRWECEGDPAPGGVGAVRRLGLGPLASREQVTAYEPGRLLAYRLLNGGPVRDYRATVELSEAPGGGTVVRWTGGFDRAVPGTAALGRWALGRVVHGLAHRLAAAAEGR